MKSIVTTLLALIVSFQTSASTIGSKSLANAIDDFSYALTVEWDQKNQDQYRDIINNFQESVSEILRKENLSTKELMATLKEKMPDNKIAQELELKLSMVPDAEKVPLLQKMIVEQNNSFYKKGASWNGEAVIGVGVLVGVLALLTVLALVSAGGGKGDCVNYQEQEHYDVVSGQYYVTKYCSEYASAH